MPIEASELEREQQHLDLSRRQLARMRERVFEHVILVDPAGIVAGEPDRTTGLRRLYVCLTRPVTSLSILHSTPILEELT